MNAYADMFAMNEPEERICFPVPAMYMRSADDSRWHDGDTACIGILDLPANSLLLPSVSHMRSAFCFVSLQLQAVKVAKETSSPIIHPIVDKIRQFSSMPDAAIDFFTSLLHPVPHQRLRAKFALQHVYLRGCLAQMLDDFGVPAPTQQLQLRRSMYQP